MEKMTYVSVLNDVLDAHFLTFEQEEKIEALIKRLSAPKSRSTAPTKTQIANAKLQSDIYDSMALHVDYTVTDLIKTLPCLTGLTTQKVSPQMIALENAGYVIRTKVKGQLFYHKVEAVD